MKGMPVAEDIEKIVESLVSSYESRIQDMECTFQAIEGFQDSFFEARYEGKEIQTEVRESLARNESLRRKDFDKMMGEILVAQDERTQDVKHLLNSYLQEQQEMSQSIRESLREFKRFLGSGEQQRIKEFQALMGDILARQDTRKREVIARLQAFQQEQQDMVTTLKRLLAKGKDLRIRDLKALFQDSKAQHTRRLARQEERKQEVRRLLETSKKTRKHTVDHQRTLQIPLAPTRAKSSELQKKDLHTKTKNPA
jgi:hypothetical protein